MRAHRTCIGLIAVGCALALCTTVGAVPMPTPFTKNMGQWDNRVLFRTVSGGATIWLCRDGITYQFTHRTRPEGSDEFTSRDRLSIPKVQTAIVHAKFVNPSAKLGAVGEGELDYKCNYFFGNDPSRWRTDVSNFTVVVYREVYPGINLRLSGGAEGVVAEWSATGGADLSQAGFSYEGRTKVTVTPSGESVIETPWQQTIRLPMIHQKPVLSLSLDQLTGGISRLEADSGLALEYSTFLGGSSGDIAKCIGVDEAGAIYVAGVTWSTDFPLANAIDSAYDGLLWEDIFVTKLSATGDAVLYSTYLGGLDYDEVYGLAVTEAGTPVVVGTTHSTDFPTWNALDDTHNGIADGFATRLSPDGNGFVYSTFLGGSNWDFCWALAVDETGNTWIAGHTGSVDFPVLDAFDPTINNSADAFVTKLSPGGESIQYSTFLGGSAGDAATAIAVGADGSIYVAGEVESSDFPTANAADSTYNGGRDGFIAKLTPSGGSLSYSTYLGGSDLDEVKGLAVDVAGRAYVTGYTRSAGFPTRAALDESYNGGDHDAFVTRLTSSGALDYSTFLGGVSSEMGTAIAVDVSGNAYVTGWTLGGDFPTYRAIDSIHGGGSDAFLTKLSLDGSSLVYSTFYGGTGSGDDEGNALAVDGDGCVYVAGGTQSPDLPMQNAFDDSYNGDWADAFVAKMSFAQGCQCPFPADLNLSGTIDAVDLALAIDVVFFGATDIRDPGCPTARTDFNADSVTDAIDLAFLIDHVFFGGPGPVDPCL